MIQEIFVFIKAFYLLGLIEVSGDLFSEYLEIVHGQGDQ